MMSLKFKFIKPSWLSLQYSASFFTAPTAPSPLSVEKQRTDETSQIRRLEVEIAPLVAVRTGVSVHPIVHHQPALPSASSFFCNWSNCHNWRSL